jgi:hypothetical protein
MDGINKWVFRITARTDVGRIVCNVSNVLSIGILLGVLAAAPYDRIFGLPASLCAAVQSFVSIAGLAILVSDWPTHCALGESELRLGDTHLDQIQPRLRIECPGREFCPILPGNEKGPQIEAQVAFGEVSVRAFTVAKISSKAQQSAYVVGDQEAQDWMLIRVNAFLHQSVQFQPVAQREAAAVARDQVAIVVKVVVPASQEGRAAGGGEKAGCGISRVE